jgi:DNA-binding IclR family transcriptional regulator
MVAPLTSVTNALRVLKSFTSTEREWGVTELARHLGVSKSSTHRLLATMLEERVLEQNPETGRYRLGLAVIELAEAVPTRYDLHEALLTPMSELRARTGETVQVAVLDGREVVFIERLDSHETLKLFREVGRRHHAHCTSTGKTLLAFLPATVLARTLRGWTLPPITPRTITSLPTLRAELRAVRERGYAENREESETGVVSIAAPVHGRDGRVLAALSVVGPTERIDARHLQIVHATIESAALISRRLGHRPSR